MGIAWLFGAKAAEPEQFRPSRTGTLISVSVHPHPRASVQAQADRHLAAWQEPSLPLLVGYDAWFLLPALHEARCCLPVEQEPALAWSSPAASA